MKSVQDTTVGQARDVVVTTTGYYITVIIITNNPLLSSPLTVVIDSGLWGLGGNCDPSCSNCWGSSAPQEKLFTYPYPVCLLRTVVRWRAGGVVSYNMPGHILESLPAQP